MGLPGVLSAALLVASIVSARLSQTGFTVELGNIPYFLPPKPVATIDTTAYKNLFGTESFIPFTVVNDSTKYSTAGIASVAQAFLEQDDVFQEEFLSAIYVQSSPSTSNLTSLQIKNTTTPVITDHATLSQGPYFLSALGQVYEAWRLYSDTNGAFTESAIANGDGSYSVLPAGTVGQHAALAVPSRLYYTPTAEKPLAGMRIGIKDIFDIKGLRTSNGNRAWYWLYPPAENTATPVQNLIDAGAIIVGKMITSQFANGEVATADWVDYHEAFNPRGDGYQDTSSSSSGGGAGIASYGWLDVALGSDTGGSVRGPSSSQGIFGNRPSHGLVSLEHTMPLSPTLDTAGLISKDPAMWKKAAKAMYKDNITFTTSFPSKIATLYWPTERDSVDDSLLIDFLGNVTEFLKANTTVFNITAAWSEAEPTLPSLDEYLNTTYATLITQEQIPLVRDPFYADYAAANSGRLPFVNPVPLVRWGWGESTSDTVDQAKAHKTTFMSWVNSTILAPSPTTCSDTLLLYVGGDSSYPTYRNVYRSEPMPPLGFGTSRISVFSEAPDFVVPIGEAPYNSTITNHVEYLPVTVDMMVAKGCDGMLFELIEALTEKGILKRAKAGQSGITGGQALFKRDRFR